MFTQQKQREILDYTSAQLLRVRAAGNSQAEKHAKRLVAENFADVSQLFYHAGHLIRSGRPEEAERLLNAMCARFANEAAKLV